MYIGLFLLVILLVSPATRRAALLLLVCIPLVCIPLVCIPLGFIAGAVFDLGYTGSVVVGTALAMLLCVCNSVERALTQSRHSGRRVVYYNRR